MPPHLVKRNTKIGIIVAIASAAIFGIYPPAARGAYADGANVVFVALTVNFMRALLMAVFCLSKGMRLFDKNADIKLNVTGGFLQGLAAAAVMIALFYLPGPVVLIILFTHTLMLLFFLAWRGEVKLDVVTTVSTASALIGLTFVLDLWSAQSTANWIGIGIAFVGALSTVIRLYVYGKQMKTRNPAVVGAESLIIAFAFLLLLVFWQIPVLPHSISGFVWTLLAGLCLSIGSFGMFYGIALLGAFRWSLFSKIEPIFTAIFSVLLLGEYLKGYQYFGMGLVIASLIVYQIFENIAKRRREEAMQVVP